jgi:signal transduction histidine kinase
MKLSFKNRIALNYLWATSAVVAVVFLLVYFIVRQTIYENVDRVLSIEAYKHTAEVSIVGDSIFFINKGEWEEREHREAQVLPVFIQLMGPQGNLMDKSPNLKDQALKFLNNTDEAIHLDAMLNEEALRQIQIPLQNKGATKGYIIAAMSMQANYEALRRLAWVELISFPVVLVILFFITRRLAARSIRPIMEITKTARRTSQKKLDERVPLPETEDELYELSEAINNLLDRIQHAFQGEKQFTSNASHELRTPLAALRGNFEVLLRKDREVSDYKQSIEKSLQQIDRMSDLSEQLLTLARMDSESVASQKQAIGLLIEESLSDYEELIAAKEIHVKLKYQNLEAAEVPENLSFLILKNIIGNALKYSPAHGQLSIELKRAQSKLICTISDEGPGINTEEQGEIFKAFYRADEARKSDNVGSGLGLSIASRAAEAINASIELKSKPGAGSSFSLIFNHS